MDMERGKTIIIGMSESEAMIRLLNIAFPEYTLMTPDEFKQSNGKLPEIPELPPKFDITALPSIELKPRIQEDPHPHIPKHLKRKWRR
jgi:hypothetical protein